MDGVASKIVVEYFCSYSCPAEERTLLAKIDQGSCAFGVELDKAARYLISITGKGKGYVCKSKDTARQHDQAKCENPKHERKQRACFYCEDEGHIASSFPLKKGFLEKKRKGAANLVSADQTIERLEGDETKYAACWALSTSTQADR